MASKHESLMQKAKDAISAVHSDQSVPPSQTIDSLTELKEDIEVMVEGLKNERQDEEELDG